MKNRRKVSRILGISEAKRRHSRPRDSQGAHAGAPGGKMRAILRRIQRAYFRRNRRPGSRATSVSALSTTSARSRALCCGFSYKNFAGTGPIPRPSGVWLQNPCGGTKCACFRDCARVFWGGCLCYFLRGKRFFGVCATTFSANRAGICTHIAGQAAYIEGTRRAKKIHNRHTRRVGRSYVALRSWGVYTYGFRV